MTTPEPREDHELAACPRCHEQPTWGRIHYYDEDGNARHDDAIRCLHCHYWFYVGSDKAETMARWNRRPSPVAESTPTDATAVEAERDGDKCACFCPTDECQRVCTLDCPNAGACTPKES